MELYKWYKGTELPDRECDCVIVFDKADYYMRGKGKDLEEIEVWETRKELGGCIKYGRKYIFLDHDAKEIPQVKIKAWMPIEFPEGVEG